MNDFLAAVKSDIYKAYCKQYLKTFTKKTKQNQNWKWRYVYIFSLVTFSKTL